MRQAIEIVGILNLVLFAAIAVVCVRQWSTERAPTALWAALAFVTLAAVIVVGKLLPDEPRAPPRRWRSSGWIAPSWCSSRISSIASRWRSSRRSARSPRSSMRSPPDWSPQPLSCRICLAEGRLVAVVVHRVRRRLHHPLVGAAADRVACACGARAVRRHPSRGGGCRCSRSPRLRSPPLSCASRRATTTRGSRSRSALLASRQRRRLPARLRAAGRAATALAAARAAQMQLAIGELMAATTEQDVAERVLPSMAHMVGARGIALQAVDGTRIAEHGSGTRHRTAT